MKALIWKELRENFRWALLAMVALGGAEFYALHHQEDPGQANFHFRDGITLCREPFLLVTLFGCAATGLALGFLQILPELPRDRWAMLLHRPVARGKIFWGKAIAGGLLYLVATGGPFLLAVWQVATPGNFPAPFVPAMIRPGLADMLAGLAYYFAALLVALEGGRLLLRALPLFAAVHLSYVAVEEPHFSIVALTAGVLALVLSVAGWGAIHARDTLAGRPGLGRAAFYLVAFYAICGLGDLAQSLGRLADFTGDRKFSTWEILDNGTPARLDYVNDVLVASTDVQGQPWTEAKYRPDRVRSFTLGMNTASSYIGDAHGWQRRQYHDDYRRSSTYLYALDPYSHPRLEQWFHLYRDGFFVGLRPTEKRAFAQLGAAGFAPLAAEVPPFPANLQQDRVGGDRLMLATAESLRLVSLGKQEIATLELPAPGPIYGMGHAWASTGTGSVTFQGIVLGTGLAVYKGDGRMVALLPYHQDVDRWGCLSLSVLKSMDRFVLQYEPSEWIDGRIRKTMPSFVEVMDAQGQLQASFTLPPLPPQVNPPTWSKFIAQRVVSPGFFLGEMCYRRIGAALGSDRLRAALDDQLGRHFAATFRLGRTLMLVALVLAVATFFWARRAQLSTPRVWAWTATVFVLGLPGFVLFWLAGERPTVVPCATCRRHRRIDHPHCAACGAAWPAPPPDATAIIDPTPAVTA